MRKRISGILIICMVLMLFSGPAAVFAGEAGSESEKHDMWPTGPEITASAAIVVEATTGTVLYEKNIYDTYYPASTTKILTTLVALENSEMSEVVTVSYAADNYVSKTSSRMGLVEGEQLTMQEALYGIMLESANEATYAVGEHVGGHIAKFIKLMNRKATQLGCVNSHFANTHGLHDDDHYTCAHDLALISLAAYRNEEFMKINGTSTYAMPETNKNEARLLTNHHWFLNKTMKYDYCIGGKTGATSQAGYALVTYAKKDGMTIISVVMHADTWNTVYTETKTLLDYTFDTYSVYKMEDMAQDGIQDFPSLFSDTAAFEKAEDELIATGSGGIVILPDGISPEDTEKKITLDTEIELEHGANTIGSVVYTYGDRVVGTSDIVFYNSDNPITEKNFRERWPAFMIPPDEVSFSETIFHDSMTPNAARPERNNVYAEGTPVFIGIGAGCLIMLIGWGIVALKNRKAR